MPLKKLSYLIIFAGVTLILYPYVREKYDDWVQNRLLTEAERSVEGNGGGDRLQSEYDRLSHLLELGLDGSEDRESEPPSASSEGESAANSPKPNHNDAAVIAIDKIDLKLPVLEGATAKNMRFAAAHLTETAKLGEPGNAAIAAHRARTKGRLFNRLNELKAGDAIKISTNGGEWEYIVEKTFRVKPTDVSVLEDKNGESWLTLITCDPLVNPTHRLIVQAKLAERKTKVSS
ncbi:sortase [Cohnella sp. CFH 77786]|uniref:class D sortase n=1 Tax=Cohnella sp. CFH 77786 TaxID=2662265 RepID=UPI001C60BD78|nr:class D sortase [Cohnella sp. CFH 77786]MBW5446708.1 sortase [Cohnella sp. CFH 77786]